MNKETRKKTRVHKLTDDHKKNRKTNCRKLYENNIAGYRFEYVITLDESLVYEDDANGQSQICYITRGENLSEKGESFAKNFMMAGIITGTVPLFRVPSNVKINAQYYVDYVLKPLFTVHLPRLYPNEMDKVYFHQDKASSHTANLTTEYLVKKKSELGISFINKDEILFKAPDIIPFDFFGFGYLKQRLSSRRAKTLDGIWKLSREIWSEIDSWKRRLRQISARDGEYIGQIKGIYRRPFKA